MAAVMETHVQIPDGTIPHTDDQSEPYGGEEEEGGDEEDTAEDEGGDDEDGSEEDGSEEDGRDNVGDDEGDGNPNAGWAEAMAKIIGWKTEVAQTSILIKNKELEKVKKKERQEYLEKKKQLDEKRGWEMMSRMKPDVVKDRVKERALQRVATRGVVQLFNAVRKHQKTVEEKVKEVGGSERKKAKLLSSVTKKDFIDVLRRREEGGGGQHLTKKTPSIAGDGKPSWSVLSDDFMMGASMKDWDKLSEEEEEEAGGGE
ncbi:RRP15-like protein isoform X1 [Halichoeres trimaculatus]|uniref:RRP15-like protein isoform X1 n=1 Tax=Halichoeres trimaculatus TaxID=147232 RepID=UPI003D9F0615